MFEGRPIQSNREDTIITDSGKRLKQLTIENVAARHAGEYTCVASNTAGSVSRSAILKVNGTYPHLISSGLCLSLKYYHSTYPGKKQHVLLNSNLSEIIKVRLIIKALQIFIR